MNVPGSGLRYIQITQVNNSVKGYAQALTPHTNRPEGFALSRVDLSGDVEGDTVRVTLQTSLSWLQLTTISGTWDGNQIKLDIPEKTNGSVEQAVYKRITVEEWNRNVEKFQQQCTQQVALLKQEQAKQLSIDKLRKDEDSTKNDLTRTWRSYADNKNGFQIALQVLEANNRNVHTMKDPLRCAISSANSADKAAHHSNVYGAEYRAGQVRYAAGQVDYQLGTAKYQRDQVQSAFNNFMQGIQSSKTQITTLQTKLEMIQDQLYILLGKDAKIVKLNFKLGQTNKITPCYTKLDVSTPIIGQDPAGCYVAVAGMDEKWCVVASKTFSFFFMPAPNIKIIDEKF